MFRCHTPVEVIDNVISQRLRLHIPNTFCYRHNRSYHHRMVATRATIKNGSRKSDNQRSSENRFEDEKTVSNIKASIIRDRPDHAVPVKVLKREDIFFWIRRRTSVGLRKRVLFDQQRNSDPKDVGSL